VIAVWKNRLKPYDLLSEDEVNTIHEQAMTILEEIGVDFLHERAREPVSYTHLTLPTICSV